MHTQLDAPLSWNQTLNVGVDILKSKAFRSIIIQSMPGTGKNAMMEKMREMLGVKHRFMIKPSHHEPYDFHGLAVPVDAMQKTVFYPSGTLLPDPKLEGGGMMVWDEFSDASTPIQNLLCQFALENGCQGYEFPPDWVHIFLGNSITHRSGAQRIITKLANRCAVIHMMPTLEELLKHAGRSGWASSVWSFLKTAGARPINPNDKTKSEASEFNPTFMNSFDPTDPAQNLKPVFASSRSWEAVSDLIKYIDEEKRSMEDWELLPRVAALVGMQVASVFVPHRSEVSAGPDPDDIAAGKKVAYPKKESVLWNLTQDLESRATKDNVGIIYDWLVGTGNREFSILFAIQCFHNKGKYLIGPAWAKIVGSEEFRQALAYND